MTRTTLLVKPKTLVGQSFSFEVPARRLSELMGVISMGDAVTVAGVSGPEVVAQLRKENRFPDIPVLFDGEGYRRSLAGREDWWVEQQFAAGADRILTPGSWIANSEDSLRSGLAIESRWSDRAGGATRLLAIDHRWLTSKSGCLVAHLKKIQSPVALILANAGDPLSVTGAVNGLAELSMSVPNFSLLRCDHGSIGALAFGMKHGSIGVSTALRHFVPPLSSPGGRRNDHTPRVFVGQLMDWFTTGRVAGWSTTKVPIRCEEACCRGARIDRFLNEDENVVKHNVTALAAIAEYVLNAPRDETRRVWGSLCSHAMSLYGPMGNLVNEIEPKSQLVQWASYA
jgi:hypothetical protein